MDENKIHYTAIVNDKDALAKIVQLKMLIEEAKTLSSELASLCSHLVVKFNIES